MGTVVAVVQSGGAAAADGAQAAAAALMHRTCRVVSVGVAGAAGIAAAAAVRLKLMACGAAVPPVAMARPGAEQQQQPRQRRHHQYQAELLVAEAVTTNLVLLLGAVVALQPAHGGSRKTAASCVLTPVLWQARWRRVQVMTINMRTTLLVQICARHSLLTPSSTNLSVLHHHALFCVCATNAVCVTPAGRAMAATRRFLSPATLVIVPVTLIPHWQQQIRQHLLPRRLRVCVLGAATAIAAGAQAAAAPRRGGGGSRAGDSAAAGGGAAESECPPAHELAWCYDVVVTTFQRLSSDWSQRGDPNLAERLVLLKACDAGSQPASVCPQQHAVICLCPQLAACLAACSSHLPAGLSAKEPPRFNSSSP